MAARGLGKGLDSLIPNALGRQRQKKKQQQNKDRDNRGRRTADPCEDHKGRA